ncbi:cysteine--tRNA ligase [Sphingobium boeckii]|uniref:Cysteine--tRNA ligase n=1 Tax=Sphingobium boeckii TaxID=1082345 RepID=A0A7W9EEB6_9SPHN|nr:cysteine--tRNA ligase [Sphingobium boeckii]MBB5685849.1 cysteinyl-tRNA synthetase [Sphingobium boeckii]
MTQGAPLQLYDSFKREIRRFEPIDPENTRVYSCGPTVYNYAHLGNLRAYVFTDTLSRVLTWKGYPLTHIINITDVGHLTSDADAGDDKMEAAARAQAKSIWDIARHYTEAFKQNLSDLNIRTPSRWSVATDHIAEMIAFAEVIAPKHCYELDSGLYFDVTTVPDYGRLARTVEDEGESRIDPVAGKRNAADFAIWRKSGPGESRQMEWDSPWGMGAPGWHLECSVMSHKYLGEQFDIHTGGIDHREIHHPNEIAQNQAHSCTPHTGANFWMHNNFLVARNTDGRGAKMSKSSGGFTTLQSIIDRGIHPLAYRLMCLSAHYRSELEFSGENLLAALTRLKRMVIGIETLKSRHAELVSASISSPSDSSRKWTLKQVQGDESFVDAQHRAVMNEFDEVISKDLNTPMALSLLEGMLSSKRVDPLTRLKMADAMDAVLGLNLTTLSRTDLRIRPKTASITEAEIEARLDQRQEARAAKDFAASDALRDALIADGVEIMDGDPLRWDWKISLD